MPQSAVQAPGSVRKPTAKQVYCVAHLMADALGLEWPQDISQASDLIQRLKAHAAAETTPQDDGAPF